MIILFKRLELQILCKGKIGSDLNFDIIQVSSFRYFDILTSKKNYLPDA